MTLTVCQISPSQSALCEPENPATVLSSIALNTATSSVLSTTTSTSVLTGEFTTTISGNTLPTDLACGLGNYLGGLNNAVGVGPVNNRTWPQIQHCCAGKPITIFQASDCEAWCLPDPSQLASLHDCYFQPNGSLAPGLDTVDCVADAYTTGTVIPTPPSCGNGIGSTTIPDPATSTSRPSSTITSSPPLINGAAPSVRIHSVGKAEVALALMMGISLVAGIIL